MQQPAHHSHMMMRYPAVASELDAHQRAAVEDWADAVEVSVDDFLALMHFSDAGLHLLLYNYQIASGAASHYIDTHGEDGPRSKEFLDQVLASEEHFFAHFSDATPQQRGVARRDLFLLGHDSYPVLPQDVPQIKYLEAALDLPINTCIRRMLLGSSEERVLIHDLLKTAETIAMLAGQKRMVPSDRRHARMLATARRNATSKIVKYHQSFRGLASGRTAAPLNDLHPINALVI